MGGRKPVVPRRSVLMRVPPSLVERARAVASGDTSLNALYVSAVEREVARREGLITLAKIAENARRMRPQPDSVPLIRAFRDGRSGRRG